MTTMTEPDHPVWVTYCDHHRCIIDGRHRHGAAVLTEGLSDSDRVVAACIAAPGYSAGYYATVAGVTRKRFHAVALRRLQIMRPGDEGWPFSYVAYYPKVTPAE